MAGSLLKKSTKRTLDNLQFDSHVLCCDLGLVGFALRVKLSFRSLILVNVLVAH